MEIEKAVGLLRAGEVVGMPTETVYGLAGDAFSAPALARIFAVKKRPFFDPLILHVADRAAADRCVAEWTPLAEQLAEKFWPGPLTLILPKRPEVPDLATSGLPLVGVRAPRHPAAQRLLRAFGGPLAAPSANRFGRISPTTAAAVREELGAAVPLVLDGGPCEIGVESSIVAFIDGEPVLLRAGGVPLEALEAVAGKIGREGGRLSAAAPGQLPQHYAPRTRVRIVTPEQAEELDWVARAQAGLIGWGALPEGYKAVCNLSPAKNFAEAAARLFGALRELDAAGVEEIWALPLPEEDLGRAVNDRLRRAAV
ncbi:MAG: L-threonylcarbamoyladenylate synthase [Verrucomicrobium sp.]|nr:L-threonylcarbamoyladenylate synthase [Verrucomicrobium sp.]